MIYPPIDSYMLSRPDHHVRTRVDINNRCFLRVRLRDPELDWKAVGRASEGHGQSSRESEEEDGRAVFVGVDLSSRG